jgi:CPA1 family monovalent cation:H+ antiporter
MREAKTRWAVSTDNLGRPTEATCSHLDMIRPVAPNSLSGCEDCLREGSEWVHLRLCLSCGHVGCCDSSPRRHARAHWLRAEHPLVQSFEPGEHWAWCYEDELLLVPSLV